MNRRNLIALLGLTGIVSASGGNAQTLIASFQQTRPPRPHDAETFPAHAFQRDIVTPSEFVAGQTTTTRQQTCPGCGADIRIEHGDRIRCGCGLFVELYGNGLTVWR